MSSDSWHRSSIADGVARRLNIMVYDKIRALHIDLKITPCFAQPANTV